MTKNNEQIIIDGVDVNGCEYYNKINKHTGQYCICELEPNCLYKQLKRKEQECEELKKHLEEESKLGHKAVQDEANTFFDLLKVQKELDQLKKENEELKLENKKLENANNALHDDLFEIKQKIKQYKKDSEAHKKCYKNNLKNLRETEFNLTKLADKYMKLEKTLEEIREIAKYILESDTEKWNGTEPFEKADEIIEKINEVIDVSGNSK